MKLPEVYTRLGKPLVAMQPLFQPLALNPLHSVRKLDGDLVLTYVLR